MVLPSAFPFLFLSMSLLVTRLCGLVEVATLDSIAVYVSEWGLRDDFDRSTVQRPKG